MNAETPVLVLDAKSERRLARLPRRARRRRRARVRRRRAETASPPQPHVPIIDFRETLAIRWHEDTIGATHRPWWLSDGRVSVATPSKEPSPKTLERQLRSRLGASVRAAR